MKLLKHLFSSFILLSIISSCSLQSGVNDDLIVSNEQEVSIIEPTFIDTLVGEGGLIRGIDFGLSVEEVRGIETARHDETDLDTNGILMVRYVEEYSMVKSADVEYYFSTSNKLNQIIFVVYCEHKQQQEYVFTNLLEKMESLPKGSFSVLKVGDEHNFNVELVIDGREDYLE